MEIRPYIPTFADSPLFYLLALLAMGVGGALTVGLIALHNRVQRRRGKGGRAASEVSMVVSMFGGAAFAGIAFMVAVYLSLGGDTRITKEQHYSNEAAWASVLYSVPEPLTLFYKEHNTSYGEGAPAAVDAAGEPGNLGYAFARPGQLIPIGSVVEERAGESFKSTYSMRYAEGKLTLFREEASGALTPLKPRIGPEAAASTPAPPR